MKMAISTATSLVLKPMKVIVQPGKQRSQQGKLTKGQAKTLIALRVGEAVARIRATTRIKAETTAGTRAQHEAGDKEMPVRIMIKSNQK